MDEEAGPDDCKVEGEEESCEGKESHGGGGTGGRGKSRPMFREGERAFMYVIGSGKKSE